MDVAGLSKLSAQAIINLVMVLGFMAHGSVVLFERLRRVAYILTILYTQIRDRRI